MRDPTTEEILNKCPEVIDIADIPLVAKGGRPVTGGGSRKRKWYSEEDRIKAATIYAVTGNSRRVEEITKIPSTTIRQWKMQPWWPQVIERIRQEADDELDSKFTKVIDSTIDQINDRLEKGDYIYNPRTGELVRKPMGGKEIAVVTSIMMDKRDLIRKSVKQDRTQATIVDRLEKLADEFKKFTGMKTIEGEASQVVAEDAVILEESAA